MTINRLALRTSVLGYMDANGSRRWDSAAGGEVDLRISGVFDRLWRRILNANRFYRVAKRTPTSDATGRYLISDLSLGSGDAAQRFYRALRVIIDGRPYGLSNLGIEALSAEQQPSLERRVWYQEGTNLTALPLQPNLTADAIWVNWIPQRPSALSGDAVAVDFPDGYEEVLIVYGAARLLMKGGAETQASRELQQEIQEDFEDLMADVARVSTDPLTMAPIDSAVDWAGQ